MPERLRVFISSPSDVPNERLRAGLIIDCYSIAITAPHLSIQKNCRKWPLYVFLEATVGTAPSKHRDERQRLCRPPRDRSVSRLYYGVQNARHFRLRNLLLFASNARGGKRHSFSPVAPV